MIIVASIEAIALVAVVLAFLRHHAINEKVHTTERRELLNRIQHPERVPTEPAVPFIFPEPDPDELELVGTIAEPSAEAES